MGRLSSGARLMKFARSRKERLFFRLLRATFRAVTPLSPKIAARWAEFLFHTPFRYRRTRRELAWLARGKFERVAFSGGRLAVWSWGEGPPVLLVHGWAGHAGRLASYVPALVEAGFRVVAFDSPGHGLSSGWQCSLPQFADAVAAVGRANKPVHGVIAHSLGATAATMAIASGLPMARAVFLAPAAEPDHYSARFARILRIPKPVRESMKARIERRYRVPWSSFRLIENLAGIRTELLVFHDQRDSKIPVRDGESTARAWPGGRFVETRGLGHHKILRDPSVIFHAVEFLTRPRPVPAIEPVRSEIPPGSSCASQPSPAVPLAPTLDLGLTT